MIKLLKKMSIGSFFVVFLLNGYCIAAALDVVAPPEMESLEYITHPDDLIKQNLNTNDNSALDGSINHIDFCGKSVTSQLNEINDDKNYPPTESESNINLNHSICRSEPDYNKKQYIAAYGSLLERKSRSLVLKGDPKIYPVYIKGYQRGWFAVTRNLKNNKTFLGVIKDDKSKINAILYEVDKDSLTQHDNREYIYCRQKVDVDDINFPDGLAIPDDINESEIWVYVLDGCYLQYFDSAKQTQPIYYSYIITVMLGCQQVENEFQLSDYTEQCIKWSSAWSEYVLDDLNDPMINNFPYTIDEYERIDRYLKTHKTHNYLSNYLQ